MIHVISTPANLISDLLDGKIAAMCHGCNAQGKMGSGIALEVRNRIPGAYQKYVDTYNKQGLEPGLVVPYVGDGHIVFNCITQRYYGRDPDVQYATYDAVFETLGKVLNYCRIQGIKTLGIPKIGCGLAGLDWNTCFAGIKELDHSDVDLYVYVGRVIPKNGKFY